MLEGNKIGLRKKRLSDAANDYAWQTDPELARLDAMPLLAIPFPEYLLRYAHQTRFPPAVTKFPLKSRMENTSVTALIRI